MQIRAVQMDLARQKENLPSIFSFIDFIKKYGHNTLVLYLEGIIRTPSFPYVTARTGYEPDEMRKVVEYAAKRRIDVIPVVSTLAHAERFLQHPELRHLAELADDKCQGRWAYKVLDQVCPSNPAVYEFFGKYLAEVAEIFPSRYFHAGLDEVWHIGMCDACRRRFKKDGKGDFLFADHVAKTHAILKKLGKTMIMWDDMFEMYPEAMHRVPRDIVMCSWYYDYWIDKPQGHFQNYIRKDLFKTYDKLGFKYILAPRDLSVSNTYTFTKYADGHRPLGGLVTIWAREVTFYQESHPHLAFAGRLWNAGRTDRIDAEKLLESAIAQTTGQRNPAVVKAVKALQYQRELAAGFGPAAFRGEIHPLEEEHGRTLEAILAGVEQADANGNDVCEDIRIAVRQRLINFRMRKAVDEHLSRTLAGQKKPNVAPLIPERQAVGRLRLVQWNKHRAGIDRTRVESYHRRAVENFQATLKAIDRADYFLRVRFFLPDVWGCPFVTLGVTGEKGDRVSVITTRTFKPAIDDQTYYELVFPFSLKGRPMGVNIEVSGYGGQGISYVYVVARSGQEFVPASVTAACGQVADPLNLLADDLRWCYLGDRNVARGFKYPDIGFMAHGVNVELTPA